MMSKYRYLLRPLLISCLILGQCLAWVPRRRQHRFPAVWPIRQLGSTITSRPDDAAASSIEFNNDELEQIQNIQSLQESLPTLSPKLIVKLRQSEQHSNETIRTRAKELNELLQMQLKEGAETLKQLLNAGEIRKLDSLIGKANREGRLNVAFFQIMTLNLQDAVAEADAEAATSPPFSDSAYNVAASRRQILQHVLTRCQEEVEKTIPAATALLNKLLRTQQPGIRSNLYQHYLTPQPNILISPDGNEVNLGGLKPVLVSLHDFVDAVSNAVKQIRTVQHAGGTDRESAAVMVESCRQVAKEARIVVGEAYGIESDELKLLEKGLQPVFRPTSAESPYIQGEL